MRFNTFNDVVAWYEQTKPIRSKQHTAHDVRPIGERKRKWERIKRIDMNTYALCDGNYGNFIWGPSTAAQQEYENTMAPIVWMRRDDGDYIRIRNHTKRNTSVTRYNFLHYHLPNALSFGYNQQGKHWVRHNNEELPLPKSEAGMSTNKLSFTADDMYLMFRVNVDGTFTRTGEKLKVEATTVDKELKKEWKATIDAFYTQAAALAPMLDTSWSGRNEYSAIIRSWCMDNGLETYRYRGNLDQIPPNLARRIVSEDTHELRIPVMALVIAEIRGHHAVTTKEDLMKIKSAYNRLMNKFLGMYETKEV